MTKDIIDKHFTENLKYYRTVCRSYYKNYLAEDLLQETYIKFVQVCERINSKDNGVLLCYGKRIITTLFKRRRTHGSFRDCPTSPLFEVSYGNKEITDCVANSIADKETPYRDKDAELRVISNLVHQGLAEEEFNTQVHVMAQIESINSMSKRTGINRSYLTKANQEKQKQLKQSIIKAYENGFIKAHTTA